MRQRRGGKAAAFLISLAAVLALGVPRASAAMRVSVDGTAVDESQGWVRDGTSYITLWAFARMTPYELSWDGSSAWLEGAGQVLEITPGEQYVRSGDRVFYAEGEIRVVNDRTVLPLRVLAKATGASLRWNEAEGTAEISGAYGETAPAAWTGEDLYWLSRIISAESRGEPLLGQIAVGNVVLNRVRSEEYPDTVRDVVFDRKYGVQFEPVSNGTVYDEPAELSVLAAKLCLEGADAVGDCLYFYSPALSAGAWIVNNRTYCTTIGCHRFYL